MLNVEKGCGPGWYYLIGKGLYAIYMYVGNLLKLMHITRKGILIHKVRSHKFPHGKKL